MKKILLLLIISMVIAVALTPAQKRTNRRTQTLTVTLAQRVLKAQINEGTVDNVLFTCRACYDPDDMGENDNFPLVTEYSADLIKFLVQKGYVRIGTDGTEYFTAKAKKSPYFETFADGSGRLGGAGFRFATFANPKISVNKIANPQAVPIQYDFVPTDLTKDFFGKNVTIATTASFDYEAGRWNVCIACNGAEKFILVPMTETPKSDASKKALAEQKWQTFWVKFTTAIHKKDFKTLVSLSSADDKFFDGGGGGTSLDWFKMMSPQWNLVKMSVASGVSDVNVYDWYGETRIDRHTKKHIPMIFMFESDNQWRFFGVMGD